MFLLLRKARIFFVASFFVLPNISRRLHDLTPEASVLDHVKSCTDLELILVATWMKKDGHGMTWDCCSESGKLFCFFSPGAVVGVGGMLWTCSIIFSFTQKRRVKELLEGSETRSLQGAVSEKTCRLIFKLHSKSCDSCFLCLCCDPSNLSNRRSSEKSLRYWEQPAFCRRMEQ